MSRRSSPKTDAMPGLGVLATIFGNYIRDKVRTMCDRDYRQAGAEITPAMIEAGFEVFLEARMTDEPLEADKLTLRDIYQAMRRQEAPDC